MNEIMVNTIITKMCRKCCKEKLLTKFNKRKDKMKKYIKEGHYNTCKVCQLNQHKQWLSKNPKYIKNYCLENKDELKEYKRQWYIKNEEREKLKDRQYYSEHKKEKYLYNKKHNLEHKEERKTKRKQHDLEHPEKRREYEKGRRKNDPIFRITKILRCRTNAALKAQGVRKSQKTFDCLGCTAEFFQNYIQSLFKLGMTLENDGIRKWHLHHIKYCELFDLKYPEQQKLCFHYTNIIPMWKDEHIKWHKNHHN